MKVITLHRSVSCLFIYLFIYLFTYWVVETQGLVLLGLGRIYYFCLQ